MKEKLQRELLWVSWSSSSWKQFFDFRFQKKVKLIKKNVGVKFFPMNFNNFIINSGVFMSPKGLMEKFNRNFFIVTSMFRWKMLIFNLTHFFTQKKLNSRSSDILFIFILPIFYHKNLIMEEIHEENPLLNFLFLVKSTRFSNEHFVID